MSFESYYCPYCSRQFTDKQLDDANVDDGICPMCYRPLRKESERDGRHENMIKQIRAYGALHVWKSIELIPEAKLRYDTRSLFWLVCKELKIIFNLDNH